MKITRRKAALTGAALLTALLPGAVFVSASLAERARLAPPGESDLPLAIALLREARKETAAEDRPDQRAILLWQVADWLIFAGDRVTASDSLREVRDLYRQQKENDRDNGLRTTAEAMAAAGYHALAQETALEIRQENTRDWALLKLVETQAKQGELTGLLEMATRIKNPHLRESACVAVGVAALRAGNPGLLEQTRAEVPVSQQAVFRQRVEAHREQEKQIQQLAATGTSDFPVPDYGQSSAEEPWVRTARALAGDLNSLEEIEEALELLPGPQYRFPMVAQSARNLHKKGKAQLALALTRRTVERIVEWEISQKQDPPELSPAYHEGKRPTPADWQNTRISEALQQAALAAFDDTGIIASVILENAVEYAVSIKNSYLQRITLENLVTHYLRLQRYPRAKEIAEMIRQPEAQAQALIRVGREYGWAGKAREAKAAFAAAERAIFRIQPDPVQAVPDKPVPPVRRDQLPLLCKVVAARKRVGDREGMEKTLRTALGVYQEMAEWELLHCHQYMALALAAAGELEQAKKVARRCSYAQGRVTGLIFIADTYLPDDKPIRQFSPDGKPPWMRP